MPESETSSAAFFPVELDVMNQPQLEALLTDLRTERSTEADRLRKLARARLAGIRQAKMVHKNRRKQTGAENRAQKRKKD